MTTATATDSLATPLEETSAPPPGVARMSWSSRVYLCTVLGTAAVLSLVLAPRHGELAHHWEAFTLLTLAAALAQLFTVRKPGFQALKPSIVFVLAAAIVLPLQLLPLFTIAQYLPEWVKTRSLAKVASFNVANGVLDALVAGGAYRGIDALPFASADVRHALGGLVASALYVGVNHFVLAVIIALTSSSGLRETGLFDPESLLTDFVIGGLGVGLAVIAANDPWMAPAVILPLVLIRRALTVPQLQAEARVDGKTGLFNSRYFNTMLTAEFARAQRFERPLALIMADLDLLRDINNNHGHLAGDVVLRGVAEIFRSELRHYDIPARFGGEEFSILLPETTTEEAMAIAERIRRRVAEERFEVSTEPEPLRATLSFGVAGFPEDCTEAAELVHKADLAVYSAKLQGRNRVAGAPGHELAMPHLQPVRNDEPVRPLPVDEPIRPLPIPEQQKPPVERRRRREMPRLRLLMPPRRLTVLVLVVSVAGIGAGGAGLLYGHKVNLVAFAAVLALVAAGQALSLELTDVTGSISVGVVGSLAGTALFDYRAALPLALVTVAVDWSARRTSAYHALYNVGTLSLASLAAAAIFSGGAAAESPTSAIFALVGIAAGAAYFAVNMGLVSLASGLETGDNPREIFQERCAWLLPHYLGYGYAGGMMSVLYGLVGIWSLGIFLLPLVLMRKSQESYLSHTRRSSEKLQDAAETISSQNASLERANQLLRERSLAAMESLSATVDARDSYTAGHSRRVAQLAVAIGRQLELSGAELEVLGRAALFHDIGKLAVPEIVLLKPDRLTPDEWNIIKRHAEEGARIIERLGFLEEAVPSIRHHHERWDGSGYPDGLSGEEIPLGARIIHVADALDSIITTRTYRAARPLSEGLAEIRRGSGKQFCPRCVAALERLPNLDAGVGVGVGEPLAAVGGLAAAS